MTDEELLRYSRHILMPAIGVEGQQKLRDAHVLVVGCGGLGSPAAMYLGASGVGLLTLVDPDVVELTNLQRQIAHPSSRLGQTKVASAAQTVQDLNPGTRVQAICARADQSNLDIWVRSADVVLDCSDNFQTRHAINRACWLARKPLVSASAVGLDAQITVFDPTQADSPCYACLFPPSASNPDAACATMGILAPLAGIAGSMQASAAIECLVLGHSSLCGRLAMIRAWPMGCDFIQFNKDAACAVCATIKSD